ncbi:ATP-dependent DNA helicase [Pseudomonas helleri]|uniref:ATP-dependent DNA helicase n=1 Tax=Pseudomonas helleri TaxID=1608996 RepID=UPI0033406443
MSYRVAVRALCEFTAKVGDLDLRFTPSPTAQQGIAGHRTVASRRSAGYQTEVSLEGQYQSLTVRGRADGYDPQGNVLEEVKTFRGDFASIPANHRQLHWAQARVYGWLLCQSLHLPQVNLALVYFDIVSEKETRVEENWKAADLEQFFNQQCSLFLNWAEQEMRHRQARDEAAQQLAFPHAQFRTGQRSLAEAVYKTASGGRCLMAQAPTGIGKTIGTLFPLIKAMPKQQLDTLMFLTAKTPGRKLALDAAQVLYPAGSQTSFRVLELVARDKACEYPENACNGDSCPLAKGFYDRLPAARQAAVAQSPLDQQTLRNVALDHQVCPYYLSQEMARWADLVIADYNYYFDFTALLYGLAQANQWRVATLVDEAHNLVERARQMYSASLDQQTLNSVRQNAPAALDKPFKRLNREWNSLHKEQTGPYQVHPQLPAKWLSALSGCITAIGDYLNDHPQGLTGNLQAFYFEALQFNRVAELFDQHFLFDVSVRDAGRRRVSQLNLRNIIPAGFIGPRLASAQSNVLFSATLSPRPYYANLLGLPADTVWIDVESPFSAQQLKVQVVSQISTRYVHREASLAPIVELIAAQFTQRPGNYLAFFSSFDYLQQVAELLAERHPQVPQWLQSRRMDEAARQGFLDQFTLASQGVGFAVLGGAFGEGIDLPGARLIGAFVATLGLAQLNPVNEQIKQRMAGLFGAGYDYTYLYPGLQKVVQAAGRVIRTQSDQGTLFLIDDRFAEPKVQQLLPGWWQLG